MADFILCFSFIALYLCFYCEVEWFNDCIAETAGTAET